MDKLLRMLFSRRDDVRMLRHDDRGYYIAGFVICSAVGNDLVDPDFVDPVVDDDAFMEELRRGG